MSPAKRPKASTIGTPIYHRKRRNWQDDRDLLLELVNVVKKLDGPYDYFVFLEDAQSGYENNSCTSRTPDELRNR